MNHAGAFGAADEMNAFSGHLERRGSRLRPRIGGANRQRKFHERTSRGAAVSRDSRQRAKNFFDREGYADDARGANENLFRPAIEPTRSFFHGFHGGGIARSAGSAIGVSGIDDDRPHTPFRSAQMCLRDDYRRRYYKILRENRGSRSG